MAIYSTRVSLLHIKPYTVTSANNSLQWLPPSSRITVQVSMIETANKYTLQRIDWRMIHHFSVLRVATMIYKGIPPPERAVRAANRHVISCDLSQISQAPPSLPVSILIVSCPAGNNLRKIRLVTYNIARLSWAFAHVSRVWTRPALAIYGHSHLYVHGFNYHQLASTQTLVRNWAARVIGHATIWLARSNNSVVSRKAPESCPKDFPLVFPAGHETTILMS